MCADFPRRAAYGCVDLLEMLGVVIHGEILDRSRQSQKDQSKNAPFQFVRFSYIS